MPDGATQDVIATSPAGSDAVQHRVIQYNGKRYSLKLDLLTWQILEQAAARSAHRLNKFIYAFSEKLGEKINLSAALRRLAVEHLRNDLAQLHNELLQQRQAGQMISAAAIAAACPSPCFVINGKDGKVTAVNSLAVKWLGIAQEELLGRSIEQYVQIKTPIPMEQILTGFANGSNDPVNAKLVYLRPGRVILSKANLCPAVRRSGTDFDYFIMVDTL